MKPIRTLAISTLLGLSMVMLACKSKPHPAPATQVQTVPQPSVPQAPKPMLDGTFSNMKIISGEGDILGIEVTVSHSQSAPSVTFQCAQGELSKRQYVAAKISGTTIRFKTRDNSQCQAANYTAVIENDTMSLSQDNAAPTAKPAILKHVQKPGDRPKHKAAHPARSAS